MVLVFGWIGGSLSVIYNIPQIYHTWKTKSSKDISIYSIFFRLTSYIFYIIHALIIEDPPLLWMTLCSLIQVLLISFQYYIYSCKKKNEKNEKEKDKDKEKEKEKYKDKDKEINTDKCINNI